MKKVLSLVPLAMRSKCAVYACGEPIVYARVCPKLATDHYCEKHGKEMSNFFINDENFTWVNYKDFIEEQEKIIKIEKMVENGNDYDRSWQIEKRSGLYNQLSSDGWIFIDVPPPLNTIVIFNDGESSFPGFRIKGNEYRFLNMSGISIKTDRKIVKWMPIPV